MTEVQTQASGRLRLDVVVPTFNRKHLLVKTLDSFARASVPDNLDIAIIVVDNNSADGTSEVVQNAIVNSSLTLRYLLETKQGLSNARNGGIAASDADLIGFIDDDEEVAPDWFQVIAREFQNEAVQYIGGPYLANWVTAVPDWLPPGYNSIVGAVPPRPRGPFGPNFGGNLMGGNAVFRRQVFAEVGGYSPQLGRGSKGLLSEEDAEMQRRLEAADIFGMYSPDLVIHHYVAPERLTRGYHRRWVYWRGVSQGVLDRTRQDKSVAYFLGVPRYRMGQALRGLFAAPMHLLQKRKGEALRSELAAWDLVGFIHGKFFLRVESLYQSASPSTKTPVGPS